MRKTLRIAGWIILILVVIAVIAWFGFLKPKPPPISEEDRARLTVMPLPASVRIHNGDLDLSSLSGHKFRGITTPRLERAVDRFNKRIEPYMILEPSTGKKAELVIRCHEASDRYPLPGDNESYSLRINVNGILLEAPRETGILRGLETLFQLVEVKDGKGSVPELTLRDKPRYPWRGLMIDACRHWIPKEVILRDLDGMAAVKMNVFHWHLTEYQAFRVESRVFPKLHEMGSGGDYYTQEEIREVVAYAADRGIRVIPEFDLPGHATSWFVGYPELASTPGPYVPDTVFGLLDPLMDPTREEVYVFLDRFFGEMAALFPDPYIHIGGDEVATGQWDENPRIRQFMSENGLEDAHALQAYFNSRVHAILKDHGKKMMGWDEIIHPGLPLEGTIVQSWQNQTSLWEAAREGYGAVLSAGYYLGRKRPAGFHYRIDPAIIPGAVDIEIDSTNWKGWDCTMHMNDMTMDAELYLFGEGEEMRGIMNFMELNNGFTDATLSEGKLDFNIDSDYGILKFETVLNGDSLDGNASISFFKMEMHGKRSGGSDMTVGKPLPEFKRIEPLNPDQLPRLLGGEACIWAEMVDGTTQESRVWPRAAAIAEKLWSPKVLTTEEEDMYRRLMVVDDRLEKLGLRHNSYREAMLRSWSGGSDPSMLRDFILLLEEDQFFNRMVLYHPQLYTYTPLNRVVDAAPAESYKAYRFRSAVNQWLDSEDESAGEMLRETLSDWTIMCRELAPLVASSPSLREVEPHLLHLSELARLGLSSLEDRTSPLNTTERQELYEKASVACGGTVLAVVEAVQKLVESANMK